MKNLQKLNHDSIVRFLDNALDVYSSDLVIIMETIKEKNLRLDD